MFAAGLFCLQHCPTKQISGQPQKLYLTADLFAIHLVQRIFTYAHYAFSRASSISTVGREARSISLARIPLPDRIPATKLIAHHGAQTKLRTMMGVPFVPQLVYTNCLSIL